MPAAQRKITPNDVLPINDYIARRNDLRKANVERKRRRRIHVGPFVTVFFESYETMLQQIQEMLYIERGGEEQLQDEMEAYNPMIPQGEELTATLMFEIDDERMRRRILGQLGGIEDHIAMMVGDDRVGALPEQDVDRTTADGKASSVQFLHFPFTPAQIAKFRDPAVQVSFVMDHPNYGHIAMLPAEVRQELASDFA